MRTRRPGTQGRWGILQQTSQPNQFVVTVDMPQSIGPGSFSLTINCNNGVTQTVDLAVNAVPGNAPATGDGSSI